jgi:hypothetical protein
MAGRQAFDIYISQFVLDEASKGDPEAAALRLATLERIAVLDVTDDANVLAEELIAGGGLPQQARVDAFHVAVATVHGMDYLLSWNCKHIGDDLAVARDFGRAERGCHRKASATKSSISARISPCSLGSLTRSFRRSLPGRLTAPDAARAVPGSISSKTIVSVPDSASLARPAPRPTPVPRGRTNPRPAAPPRLDRA